MVEVQTTDVLAYYQYYTAPKLSNDAYLVAMIKNWEDYDLLPAKAHLFFEGTFVGSTFLTLTQSSDTLSISLGKDKGVIVNRTKLKTQDGRQLIGSQKIANRAYEIVIRNNKSQPINILVQDIIPQSIDKDVLVENVSHASGKLEEKTGFVTWESIIKSGESQKYNLKYSVKYPKSLDLYLD